MRTSFSLTFMRSAQDVRTYATLSGSSCERSSTYTRNRSHLVWSIQEPVSRLSQTRISPIDPLRVESDWVCDGCDGYSNDSVVHGRRSRGFFHVEPTRLLVFPLAHGV